MRVCGLGSQGFFITILALCDAGDEVVLFAPYYFSHYNALTACGVAPVVVECDPTTLLPRDVGAVRDAFTPRTKAVVLVSPGNPSGVVVPRAFVDALCALCKEKDVWVISDEAYKEISYDGEEAYVPRPLAGVVRMYTMSKVYGLAGWRVGALLYPKCLSVHLRKMQDTIPTHATILSQVVALRAFELDLPRIPRRVLDFAVTRASFLRHLAEVYDERPDLHVVLGTGAYYLFLPVGEERRGIEGSGEEMEVVSFLAQKAKVLVVPGSAFGMSNYIRVSFGSVPMDRAEAAAKVLKAGLMAWFSALPGSS
jgi:aromatic aminotransferase